MTTLAQNLSDSATQMWVNAAVAEADRSEEYTIDTEVVRVTAYSTTVMEGLSPERTEYDTLWQIERGVGPTTVASHTAGATLTPFPGAGGGAAEAGTVVVDESNDVFWYVSDGPPASTSGVGALYLHGENDIYLNTGTAEVPIWTSQGALSITSGVDAPIAASNPGDWYIQIAFTLTGFLRTLYQDDGVGGWTGVADLTFAVSALTATTDAGDAFMAGIAGPGSMVIDRTTVGASGWYQNVNTKAAPVWAPMFASLEQGFSTTDGALNPGLLRLVNVTIPASTTYVQLRDAFKSTNSAIDSPMGLLGLPPFLGVRIAALFHHVLPSAAQAAGIRLRWDEINYLFFADLPVADPDTGVVTYTELDDADTILSDVVLQMLVQGYAP